MCDCRQEYGELCNECEGVPWDDDGEYGVEDEDGWPVDRDCFWCDGDGWVECRDPIQCTHQHDALGYCKCASCGGSGRAEDMTIW